MKILYSILIGLLFITATYGKTIFIEPSGDYAQIDTSDITLMKVLQQPSNSMKERQKIANQINQNPGSYSPCVLLAAAPYFLLSKDFEKAATLVIGAIYRAAIDVRIANDKTLGDVTAIMRMHAAEFCQELIKTETDKKNWENALTLAIQNFEKWDRKTPRNYDDRWVRLHSLNAFIDPCFETISEKEKQQIIERFYEELNHVECESDYETASMEDEYYFDHKNRTFYYTESKLSFHVPKKIKPIFDYSSGKFAGDGFTIPDYKDSSLWVDKGWSLEKKSFQWKYELVLSRLYPNETLKRVTLKSDIPCYRKRSLDRENTFVVNSFYFAKGHFDFEFELTCRTENEADLVEEVMKILNSLKFY